MLALLQRHRVMSLILTILLAGTDCVCAETIVVCPTAFREAIKPWIAHRSRQGHRIRLIASQASATELRKAILLGAGRNGRHTDAQSTDAENAGSKKLGVHKVDAILLIGDTGRLAEGPNRRTHMVVPTHYLPARIITRFGGERKIASDNPYGDFDGDQIPDVPVGRLSADSPEELSGMIQRIIAYESSVDFAMWRRQVNLIAGMGGFGGLIDGMIESTTKMFLTSGIPAGYKTSLTQASWTSPYCPDPRSFCDTTVGRMNEGCLFWIYMGHGQTRQLDRMNVPGNRYPILTAEDIPRINCQHHAPVALFFSCYAASYDTDLDCLGEELMKRDHGPVAVLGGSRVTMPYAMATLGSAMIDECFQHRRATIGEMFVRAKRRMADNQPEASRRKMLDSLGLLFGGSRQDLIAERYEHLHLFNLLGDPLLRIRHPGRADVSAPKLVDEGSEVLVHIDTAIAGRATVELVVRRDRLAFAPPRRAQYQHADEALKEFQKVYLQANDPCLATAVEATSGQPLDVRLKLPMGIHGPCHARVFIEGRKDFAMGATDIFVRRPPPEPAPVPAHPVPAHPVPAHPVPAHPVPAQSEDK